MAILHDIRLHSRYIVTESRSTTGRQPGDAGCPERVRFPRAAANGKTPGRHDDRSATFSLDWDRPPSGNAWRMPRPRKRVLELSGGVGSRSQVPRWNAVRRARHVWREPRRMARNIGRHAPGGVLLPDFIALVARVERSETRGRSKSLKGPIPGFALLNPGY